MKSVQRVSFIAIRPVVVSLLHLLPSVAFILRRRCISLSLSPGIVVQVTGTNWPRPAYTLLVTGLCRFKLESLAQESPYLVGMVKQLDRLPGDDIGKCHTFSPAFTIKL